MHPYNTLPDRRNQLKNTPVNMIENQLKVSSKLRRYTVSMEKANGLICN